MNNLYRGITGMLLVALAACSSVSRVTEEDIARELVGRKPGYSWQLFDAMWLVEEGEVSILDSLTDEPNDMAKVLAVIALRDRNNGKKAVAQIQAKFKRYSEGWRMSRVVLLKYRLVRQGQGDRYGTGKGRAFTGCRDGNARLSVCISGKVK